MKYNEEIAKQNGKKAWLKRSACKKAQADTSMAEARLPDGGRGTTSPDAEESPQASGPRRSARLKAMNTSQNKTSRAYDARKGIPDLASENAMVHANHDEVRVTSSDWPE